MSAETDAAQAIVDALFIETQSKVDELQAAREVLAATKLADLDNADAEVAGLVTAIDNAVGTAKTTLQARLYSRVLQGVVEAGDDEIQRGRARGRAAAALGAEDLPVQPLSARPPRGGPLR